MKYLLSKEDETKIRRLFEVKEMNMKAATFINHYLESDQSKLSKIAKEYKDKGHSNEEAFRYAFKKAIGEEEYSFLEDNGYISLSERNPKPFLDDSYAKNISFNKENLGDWEILRNSYKPYQGFVYDELSIKQDEYFKEVTPMGFFPDEFQYLEVKQGGVDWMSLTPHEILTMQEQVAKCRGHVMTFGLGLGYFAYMAHLNENVEDVTIVELDPKIISLFKERILPQFPHKEKIKIINQDAFKVVKKLKDGEMDYIFDDIYHLPTDGLYLYLPLRRALSKFEKSEVDHWIEPSLLSLLRRAVLILMEEEMNGSSDEDYDFAATQSDLLINRLHKILKKKVIASFEDAKELCSEASLKALDI